MRLLWSLPKAAPALLRHLEAYVELAGQDLARARRELAENFLALAVVAASLFFTALMGCAAVVALTWDTPHRLAAILGMGLFFLGIAAAAMIYRSRSARENPPFPASVREAWREDRAILERILSDKDR
ncbi:MAG TPA: phage holin family protein [Steroidobacteraceae bacterium]|nr:phage holin family protein [Steroidobacteraceae bacterium]